LKGRSPFNLPLINDLNIRYHLDIGIMMPLIIS